MSFYDNLINNFPQVKPPSQKKLGFNEKLKWTGVILGLYFLLTLIPLYGLGENALEQFRFLSMILGASFGSIVSLGIGPIVTASIVLQLLNGSGIVNFELTKPDGRRRFQGTQKILAVFFIVIEAIIFVVMGGLRPEVGISSSVLIFQLILGGLFILFMDEIVSKYGFGSGVGLFIAAGVSQEIVIQLFNPLPSPFNPDVPSGAIPVIITSLGAGETMIASIQVMAIIATIAVFAFVVFVQAMKVEIPLSFGRVKGHGVRWPLNFLYASVIPVILVSALIANIQLLARLFENMNMPIFGTFDGEIPSSGLVFWFSSPNVLEEIVIGTFSLTILGQALTYIVVFVLGATVFSIFWVQTAGLDAGSQAKQMMASGLQVPGFRRDQRVLERLLKRYIGPLTVMGGISIGLLASVADLTGAIGTGTGILLAVMIIYKIYEEIAKQHMYDMNPMMRKFMAD